MGRLAPLLVASAVTAHLVSAVEIAGQAPASNGQDFQRAVTLIESRGDCAGALKLLEPIGRGADRALAARALVYTGSCHERLAVDRARRAYQQVIERFPDQTAAVAEARARLRAIDRRGRSSPAVTTLRKFLPEDADAVGYVGRDGRFLALIDAEGRLGLRDLSTGTTRTLFPLWPAGTPEPQCAVQWPVIASPSGRYIAYGCEAPGLHVELRVAPVNRPGLEGRTVLTAPAGDLVEPREWLDNARLLIQFTQADAGARFAEVVVRTGTLRSLATLARAPGWFSLSPDGAYVAYDVPADQPGTSRVIVGPSGGTTETLVHDGAALPVWSHDGSQLLFVSDRTGSTSLWGQPMIKGAARGSAAVLYPDLGRVVHPAGVTSHGSFIYLRQTGLVDVYAVELDERGRPRGTPQPVGGQVGSSRGPSWSASGELVYLTEFARAGARQVLGFTSMATGQKRQAPTGLTNLVMARWANDGRRIVARGTTAQGGFGLHIIDPASATVRPLIVVPTTMETSLGMFTPHPTEARVLYTRFGRPIQVLSRALDSTEERVVLTLDAGHRPVGLAVSPADGSLAYIDSTAGGTTVRHVAGDGTLRDVLRAGQGEVFEGISWMPDGSTLLLTKSGPAGPDRGESLSSAWRVSLATGAVESLGIAMPGLRLLSASPDGRWLAFTAGWPRRELWTLENFLRPAPNTTWPLRSTADKP